MFNPLPHFLVWFLNIEYLDNALFFPLQEGGNFPQGLDLRFFGLANLFNQKRSKFTRMKAFYPSQCKLYLTGELS